MTDIKYTHRYYPNENSSLYIRAFVENINENAKDGRFYGMRFENGNFVWTKLEKIKLIEERN